MFCMDALQIFSPHTDKLPPNPHLLVHLIVCDVRQVCGEAGNGGFVGGTRVEVLVSDITWPNGLLSSLEGEEMEGGRLVSAIAGPWGWNYSQGAIGGVLGQLGFRLDQVRKL
jgi:hypothetical protein